MTQHQGQFTIERQVPAAEAAPGIAGQLANPPQALPRPARRWMRKALLVGVGALAFAGAGHFGWQYWTVGQFQVSTDDAYVQADNTTIAPKVSGYIAAVLVGDNEPVKAGQTLAPHRRSRLPRRPRSRPRPTSPPPRRRSPRKQASLEAQQSVVEGARAAIGVDEANLTFAEQDDKRYASARRHRLRQRAERPAGGFALCRAPAPPSPATRRRSRRRSARSTS